jgi:hypothetical protein
LPRPSDITDELSPFPLEFELKAGDSLLLLLLQFLALLFALLAILGI